MTAATTGPAIPHLALLLICDGSRALIARNVGSALKVQLEVLEALQAPDNPPARGHASDRPGRVVTAGGARRSAVEAADHHALSETAFLKEAVRVFLKAAGEQDAAPLAVIAPPAALAAIRKRLARRGAMRPVVQIPKDLTKHPIEELERILTADAVP